MWSLVLDGMGLFWVDSVEVVEGTASASASAAGARRGMKMRVRIVEGRFLTFEAVKYEFNDWWCGVEDNQCLSHGKRKKRKLMKVLIRI